MTLEELKAQAGKLSDIERELLALDILGPDQPSFSSSEIERAWLEEAERRYNDYLAGKTKPVPAADVTARLRAKDSKLNYLSKGCPYG